VLLGGVVALLATAVAGAGDVSWVGPANGQWNVGTNWSGGEVPQAADNVTIAGAAVNVSDARMVSGSFVLTDNALLLVDGESASFQATGTTTLSNGRVSVMDGAMASFPNATEYRWTLCEPELIFQVVNPDSVLSLPGLTSIEVDAPGCDDLQASILVSDDALLELDALESVVAAEGQKVAISWLVGGETATPNLETLDRAFLLVGEGSAVALPALSALTNSFLTVNAGGMFAANGLTAAEDCVFTLAGAEGAEFALLRSITSCLLTFSSTGTVTLPELLSIRDSNVSIGDGITLSMPKLNALEGIGELFAFATVGTGAVSAPSLTTVRNMVFVASLGSTLSLPSVQTMHWDLCEGGALLTTSMGSTIDFSGLRSITIQNSGCPGLGYPISATGDSSIDLSGLTTVTAPAGQFVSFFSSNTGTVIDVSSLVTFNALIVSFFENDGGRILRAGSGGEGEGEGEGEGGAGCPAPSKAGRSARASVLGDLFLIGGVLGLLGAARRKTLQGR